MPPQHPAHLAVPMASDRPPIPRTGNERKTLVAFLEWHRRTLELKCSGVPRERMSEALVPPSRLTLHGLVRHLAGVERWWFQIQYDGREVPLLHYTDDNPDLDFEGLDGDPAEDLEIWRREMETSRAIVAAAPSLDEPRRLLSGEPASLRWVLVHSIAEYARHNGHADLLRERVDGLTGH